MPDLTKSQEAFLARHNISNSSVLDARGLKPKTYKSIMRELEKIAAFGVTPCKKNGHRLRNRSGHCLQCNPAALAFQARHTKTGYVYVAGSQNLRLIKIGFSSDVDRRMESLNHLNYADTSDWACLYWISSEAAGKLEFESQKIVKPFLKPSSYNRDGRTVKCLETFACGAKHAIETIEALAPESSASWHDTPKLSEYEFHLKKEEPKPKTARPKTIKKKSAPSKPKKLRSQASSTVLPSPKVTVTPSPVLSFHEAREPEVHVSGLLSKEQQIVIEKSTVKNQSRFSPSEKILFYGFLFVIFSLGSSMHHLSRVSKYIVKTPDETQVSSSEPQGSPIKSTQISSESNLQAPIQSSFTSEVLERPTGKARQIIEIPTDKSNEQAVKDIGQFKNLASLNVSTSITYQDLDTQSIKANPSKEDATDKTSASNGLEKYIGKNRLAIRSDEGAPIKVTNTATYILWHYPGFKVYINKSDNLVVKIVDTTPPISIR